MESLEGLQLEAWREACRHIHIEESAAAIAAILARHRPGSRLLVRLIDVGRSCLETAAFAPVEPDHPLRGGRTQCSAADMKRVVAWCTAGRIGRRIAAETRDPIVDVLVPGGIEGDVLAAPLTSVLGPLGLLLLVPGQPATVEDEALVRQLLEPLAVALENDRRLREMAALREAAEADRSSLLSRLGRQSLGDTIVGEQSGLQGVMERVELVSRSDVPVLIFGETGTGKELIARSIHTRSARSAGPFMRVNCGAIPPELIDSHLFGHERGSFTGATDQRRGWFERADRGTLFLDEIGELPTAAQVRLLRVLQDGAFERVGGQQPVAVDVRIVAATHRDLSSMVGQGLFREDLWYRLAVFPVVLPPLRDRPQDIPALARHFAQRAAIRFGLAPQMPSEEDVRLLASYAWPGNVRELGAVMDRAAILGDGRRLDVDKALGGQQSAIRSADAPSPPNVTATFVSLDEAMRQHIEQVLRATQGRVEGPQGAAKILKINPHTLRARMRKLGIDWTAFRES